MRLTIVTVGSTGDVQPYVALGTGLTAVGHRVRIATHTRFEALITGRGLEFAPINGDPRREVESDLGQEWLETGENGLAFLRGMERVLGPMMVAALRGVWDACEDADAVLYSILGWLAAHHVIEKRRIPGIAAYLQPITATRAFPPVGVQHLKLGGWYNLLLHRAGERMYWRVFRRSVNRARQLALGLPPLPKRFPFEVLARERPVLYGYSPALLPKPRDWPDNAHVTGYWFLDRAQDWEEPPGLRDFLNAGPAPVYVGFGSMHRRDARQLTELVTAALGAAGQRGVLATGWGGLSSDNLPDTVFPVGFVPHDWLLPRMAAVVHHAGAGTSGAGLRAGVPAVCIPFFADQPFWARRLFQSGVGPPPIPFKRVTKERLARAISAAVGDSAYRDCALALGRRVRGEDGVGHAVRCVDAYLSGRGDPGSAS